MKKLRGHNRIFKKIEKWKHENLHLDIDALESYQRNYVKIYVSPFSDISIAGREIPSPKGKTKKLILESLFEIHNSWEEQLKNLEQPYYLAIWLYEPNFKNSQVVCAIGDYLDWYNVTFYRPKD